MIEIEAKFKLANGITRKELLCKLGAQFTKPISEKHQVDTVFLLPEQVDSPIVSASKIMRVRDVVDLKSGKVTKSLMTLKIEKESKLVSDEYEFEVESGKEARKMLSAIGWCEVVTVDKLRAESKIDKYHACIDEVAGLGLFIELEILAENGADAKSIQADMKKFLKKLDLSGEIWTVPYDTSIRNLQSQRSTKRV